MRYPRVYFIFTPLALGSYWAVTNLVKGFENKKWEICILVILYLI
ncbi:hypothetical protein WY13_01822 [Clostridium ljungdahlii]|uniref:Uncharacterized protein n=1 Tax=Clostridium ljungdahlii TaxID=1538 RepID=A0A162KXK3_9CLOT|nr:hypothetical protein WY13_01822 [Clostridium ljungdahlii]